MLNCFLCKETTGCVLCFNAYNFEKCHRMSKFRKNKGFKYADVTVPQDMNSHGYHVDCYRKFVVLKEKYKKEYQKLFDILPRKTEHARKKICIFCGKNERSEKRAQSVFTCTKKVHDATMKQAETLEDSYLLSKIEEFGCFDYHPACRTRFVEKYRKFLALQNCKYSMPLQQRLTAIASTSATPEPEKPIPTLKSQPLSPTKLKVTRQSSSKPQQQHQQPKPVEEEVQPPIREEICLKWNTHHSNMQTAFPALLNKEQYCDVTLVADGMSLKCHKLILSSCSSYFDQVLEKVAPYQHPIIFMKDIPFNIMKALCDFMYVGEVNILQSDLDQILVVGESLKIKGLANKSDNNIINNPSKTGTQKGPAKNPKVTSKPIVPEKKDSVNDADITDPLDLMEPTYEEAATPDVPPPVLKRNEQARKSTGRKVRKRKHVEVDHEPSPPVFRMRKGTRSRPNVKVPRYFNANFDNSVPTPAPEPSEFVVPNATEESLNDPFLNILDEIKTEPLDIEDSFEEENYIDEMHHRDPDTEEYDPGPMIEETQKVLKKRRTSRSAVVAKQEKLDPLNVDHNVAMERQVEQMEIDSCERIENQEENDHIEMRLQVHAETSDRDEVPIENSDREEMQIDNSDKGERLADNIARIELHLQNSDFCGVENDGEDAMHLENSEYEERPVEDTVGEEIQLVNCEQERLPEVTDQTETVIDDNVYQATRPTESEEQIPAIIINNEGTPIDNSDTSIENSDTLIENSDTLIENNDTLIENSDTPIENSDTFIENSEKEEIQSSNIDTRGIQHVYFHKDETSQVDIRIEDGTHIEDTGKDESDVQSISKNCIEEEKRIENDASEVNESSEEKLYSVQDAAKDCSSESNKHILKENTLNEVLIHSLVQEGINSKDLSTTEEDPLK